MKRKTIGIPRAMYYYEFGEIWTRFFDALGLETLVSDETDSAILSTGVSFAASDLCLPIKAMFGHIDNLLHASRRPDYLFLPNMYMTGKGCYTCPRVIGLTAMIQAVFDDLPTVIAPDCYGNTRQLLTAAGRELGFSLGRCVAAYRKALTDSAERAEVPDGRLTVALIGHCYMTKDNCLNMQIRKRLSEMQIRCVTPDETPSAFLYQTANRTQYKKTFWTSAGRNLGYTKYVIDNRLVQGVIYLSAFGCGTDALSLAFCREYIRSRSDIPCITVSLDGHHAQAGLVTRLEAFSDCLKAAIPCKEVKT